MFVCFLTSSLFVWHVQSTSFYLSNFISFSLQPTDSLQNAVIENIKRFNTFNSQLSRPPDLAIEDYIKPLELSATDLFLVSFCSGLREAYCSGAGCCLDLLYQKDFKPITDLEDPRYEIKTLNFEEYCKKKRPLPDSLSSYPSQYLKVLVDQKLKPATGDSLEKRAYKERTLSRLYSLLLWIFKDAKHTSTSTDGGREITIIRQNALLVPLCFLPFVSVVCHKMMNVKATPAANPKLPCHTDQQDARQVRPPHSLMGYVAVTPKRVQVVHNKEAVEPDHSDVGLWKKFLPNVADDNCFPSQFFYFTKMSQSDGKNWKRDDYAEGRYVSLLSHYVHLLLEAVMSDYSNKKNMYSVHLDNLVCNLWASTMFPWLITQQTPVPEYLQTFDAPMSPFRRKFEDIRSQKVPYLYDDSDDVNPRAPINQSDAYDEAERFALPFLDGIYEYVQKLVLYCSVKCRAHAAKPGCHAECSLWAILLLVAFFVNLFFVLPYIGDLAVFLFCVIALFACYLSLVVYMLTCTMSAPRCHSFSEMTRESTDAFFLHRWATVRAYCIRL